METVSILLWVFISLCVIETAVLIYLILMIRSMRKQLESGNFDPCESSYVQKMRCLEKKMQDLDNRL